MRSTSMTRLPLVLHVSLAIVFVPLNIGTDVVHRDVDVSIPQVARSRSHHAVAYQSTGDDDDDSIDEELAADRHKSHRHLGEELHPRHSVTNAHAKKSKDPSEALRELEELERKVREEKNDDEDDPELEDSQVIRLRKKHAGKRHTTEAQREGRSRPQPEDPRRHNVREQDRDAAALTELNMLEGIEKEAERKDTEAEALNEVERLEHLAKEAARKVRGFNGGSFGTHSVFERQAAERKAAEKEAAEKLAAEKAARAATVEAKREKLRAQLHELEDDGHEEPVASRPSRPLFRKEPPQQSQPPNLALQEDDGKKSGQIVGAVGMQGSSGDGNVDSHNATEASRENPGVKRLITPPAQKNRTGDIDFSSLLAQAERAASHHGDVEVNVAQAASSAVAVALEKVNTKVSVAAVDVGGISAGASASIVAGDATGSVADSLAADLEKSMAAAMDEDRQAKRSQATHRSSLQASASKAATHHVESGSLISRESVNATGGGGANATSNLTEEERSELDLISDAEELSHQAQITTKVKFVQKKVVEKVPFMLLKSESVRAQCFLKCLELNPLSGLLYIATCHRGPNQRWKISPGPNLEGSQGQLLYEYDTWKARVCTDFFDWRKAEHGVAYRISIPGKPYGYKAVSWMDCRASCYAIVTCKQAVYNKGTRACRLLKAALETDQDNLGGRNVAYNSAHCKEGDGLPKCLTWNSSLAMVGMSNCVDDENAQKWAFKDHQIVNQGDGKRCLGIDHVGTYGKPDNKAWNVVNVKEKCDQSDSSQRWHFA